MATTARDATSSDSCALGLALAAAVLHGAPSARRFSCWPELSEGEMLDLAYYAVLDHGPRVAAALALTSWYGTVAAVLLTNAGPRRELGRCW